MMDTMSSFWLTFESSALEKQFTHHMIEKNWRLDGVFVALSGIVVFVYLIRSIGEGSDAPIVPMIFSLLNVLLIAWVRNKKGIPGMLTWRSPLLTVSRLLGYYGLSLVHPRLRWNFSFSSDHPVLALINVMQAHNVLGSCFPAIGFKLKFRDHVWTRAIETFLILYVQTQDVCTNVLEHHKGDQANGVESSLDSILCAMLQTLYGMIGLPAAPRVKKSPCYHLAYCIHILITYGVISYVIWRLERWSRIMFLNARKRADDSSPPHPETLFATPTQEFCNVFVFLCICCMLWELLGISLFRESGSSAYVEAQEALIV